MKAPMRLAANGMAWAIGQQRPMGFHIRRIVWGTAMARAERREGEEIRPATIIVGPAREWPRQRAAVATEQAARHGTTHKA